MYVVCQPVFAEIKTELFGQDSYRSFLFDVAIVWLNARCLSFNCDRLDNLDQCEYVKQNNLDQYDFILASQIPPFTNNEFIHLFAYMFYLPTFFTGPINQYESFVKVSLLWNKPKIIGLCF